MMATDKKPRHASGERHPGKNRHEKQLKPKKKHKHPTNEGTDVNTSLTELRSRIRSLEKMLAHDEGKQAQKANDTTGQAAKPLPAHIRQEKERALAGYKHDLDLATQKRSIKEQRRKMVSKYHHVRFFERKKAEKALKKARKAHEAGEVAEETVLNAQTDLDYALYSPLGEKYVSLWPKPGVDDPDQVRSGTTWVKLREVRVRLAEEGLDAKDIGSRLLKIRDDGWPMSDTAIAPLNGHEASTISTKSHFNSAQTPNKKSSKGMTNIKSSKTSSARLQKAEEDEAMDSDSSGFFEK